ncbi:FAS1 domain-containing protein [Conidiobolus coronatus NRRL 28638]|uniref:FAS1 domain-containing protein n=1 Tax=Conidiobolus coronatus (strain ATCC 28846 / CBS 209.66 / NRRL 28638) TaxID=796925 RepID=A0A137PFP8_CONC2|nr:FAS1 domain-containing protein [Conidiobolus coronatus NRRL 28638]|eukprot:KXN73812.1 FAS1 domain-containing protein [Conidiobolus coronatus NRRL 28638]
MLIRLNLLTVIGLVSIVAGADIPAMSFMDVIASQKELSSFHRILSTPEMDKVVGLLSSADRKFTVFAPTNEALAELKDVSKASKVSVQDIILYHIVEGEAKSNQIKSLHFAPTMFSVKEQTQALKIARTAKGIELSSGPAPPVNVIKEDFSAKNGQLHIIEKVLDVPVSVSKTLQKAGLTKFLAAATQNDLIVTMDRQRGVTVLAPSNEAMDKLLTQNPEMTDHELHQVLKLLVVPNQIRYTNRILTPVTVESMGGPLVMERSENDILVNGIKISNADIITTSGVLHVIDEVPFKVKGSPNADSTSKPSSEESSELESESRPQSTQEQQEFALQPESELSSSKPAPEQEETSAQPEVQQSKPRPPSGFSEFASSGKVKELIAASLKAIEESTQSSAFNLAQIQPQSETQAASLAEALSELHNAPTSPVSQSETFSELVSTSTSNTATPHSLTETSTESVPHTFSESSIDAAPHAFSEASIDNASHSLNAAGTESALEQSSSIPAAKPFSSEEELLSNVLTTANPSRTNRRL